MFCEKDKFIFSYYIPNNMFIRSAYLDPEDVDLSGFLPLTKESIDTMKMIYPMINTKDLDICYQEWLKFEICTNDSIFIWSSVNGWE